MLDKPVSQKLPVARCYSTYIMNGNMAVLAMASAEWWQCWCWWWWWRRWTAMATAAEAGSAVAAAVTVAKVVADNNRNCRGRQQSIKCGRWHW